jgi:DNA-damage-inducible protein J
MTTLINVNVDTKIKEDATSILKGLGLNMSTAINMFLTQVVKRNGIPFEIVNPTPSKDMIEALAEVEDMINNPEKYPRYSNREDLKKALLSDE